MKTYLNNIWKKLLAFDAQIEKSIVLINEKLLVWMLIFTVFAGLFVGFMIGISINIWLGIAMADAFYIIALYFALKRHEANQKLKTRQYNIKLDPDLDEDIYTLEEWEIAKVQCINNYDGCGYWVKNGMKSNDEVFNTPELDATHITWYSK
jgi:hypothetical protein